MITTDHTENAFVRVLLAARLLTPEQLEDIKPHLLDSPNDLADHLVAQKLITRFQATELLEGRPQSLILSHYSLLDIIGEGSMGAVYKARSSKDNQLYAVKVVPRRNIINLRSIAEKVEALKQVRHPRVSAMVHVGAQGDRAFMVYPLLEGGEKLDVLVRKHERLTPRQSAQIGLQLASGLQAYHEHGLFHGLLKASDVVIGRDRRVRLLDFGVGFLLTCDQGKALLDTMTNNKALARGLDCASPESILNPLNRTTSGDLYSLGCILYFCVAGRYPFPEGNPVKKMLAHQTREPTPLSKLAEDCSGQLEDIVHHLLEKKPEDRYQSVAELIADLQVVTSDRFLPSPNRYTKAAAETQIEPKAKSKSKFDYHPQVPPEEPVAREPEPEVQSPLEEAEPPPESKNHNNLAFLWVAVAGVAGVVLSLAAWTLLRS